MAASYLEHDIDAPAVFKLFVRRLPVRRQSLLVAGLGPALALVRQLSFGEAELSYLTAQDFGERFLRFCRAFASPATSTRYRRARSRSPTSRCYVSTAPRIQGQLLETLLLNQVNFQTMGSPPRPRGSCWRRAAGGPALASA